MEIHHDGCNKKFLLNKYHLPNTHLFHVHHCKRLSMFLSKSEQILNPISQGNQGRSCFRQHVAKSYFETYKCMITCKILSPYLKNSAWYRDLKNLSFWDFFLPWLTEIAITRSIFEIQGSYFGFIPLFMCSINHV